MVSGLGATPVMELYIVYRKLAELLGKAGISHLPSLCRQLLHLAGNVGGHGHA